MIDVTALSRADLATLLAACLVRLLEPPAPVAAADLLDVRQAAALLGVRPHTLHKRAYDDLRVYTGSRVARYSRAKIEARIRMATEAQAAIRQPLRPVGREKVRPKPSTGVR